MQLEMTHIKDVLLNFCIVHCTAHCVSTDVHCIIRKFKRKSFTIPYQKYITTVHQCTPTINIRVYLVFQSMYYQQKMSKFIKCALWVPMSVNVLKVSSISPLQLSSHGKSSRVIKSHQDSSRDINFFCGGGALKQLYIDLSIVK